MNQPETTADFQKTIVVEYEFPYPPEKVWRVLTVPDLLAAWLMPNDIQPVVGHKFTFQTKPVPGYFDGIAHCEILVVEPNRRLSYSWTGGSHDLTGYGAYLNTVVTWTLTPKSDGSTHLRLEHDGFTQKNSYAFTEMGQGWKRLSVSMEKALSTLV